MKKLIIVFAVWFLCTACPTGQTILVEGERVKGRDWDQCIEYCEIDNRYSKDCMVQCTRCKKNKCKTKTYYD